MSQMAGGEALYVDILADASGFRRDLETKLQAAAAGAAARVRAVLETGTLRSDVQKATRAAEAGARVRIAAEINARTLRTQVTRATREATKGVTGSVKVSADFDRAGLLRQVRAAVRDARAAASSVRIGAELSTRGLKTSVRKAVAEINATRPTIKVHADFDADGLAAKVRAAVLAASAGVKIDVDVDTAAIAARIAAAIRAGQAAGEPIGPGGGGPSPVPGGGGGGGAASAAVGKLADGLLRVSLMATLAGAAIDLIYGAAGGLVNLGGVLTGIVGGLYAIVAAAGPAASALAAIPAGVSILAQGLVTAVLGFGGIGDAVKGLQENTEKAGSSASKMASAQEAAANRVRSAQRSLQSANDAVADSQGRIAKAQREVEQAALAVGDAERQLADAREQSERGAYEATRRVENAERSATESVEDAVQARMDLAQAYKDATDKLEDYRLKLSGAALDEESASLAVEKAAERLKEANWSDAVSDLDKRGADLDYRQAIQRLEEVRDSNADLRTEADAAAKAGVDGAANVLSAQEKLIDADRRAADAQLDLADARYDQRKQEIDGAAAIDRAVRGLADAQYRQTEAQEGVADAARGALRAQERLTDAQADLASAQRNAASATDDASGALSTAQKAYQNASEPAKQFARFLVDRLYPAMQTIRTAAQRGLLPGTEDALTRMLVLTQPLADMFERTGEAIAGMFGEIADSTTTDDYIAGMGTLSDQNVGYIESLGGSLARLFPILQNVAIAAEPVVSLFTDWLDRTTRLWEETSKLNDGQSALEQYFKDGAQVLKDWVEIIGNIWRGFGNVADAAWGAGTELTASLAQSTRDFERWSEDNQSGITAWFNAITPVLQGSARIILDIIQKLGDIAADPSTRRFVDKLEKEVGPALGRLSDALMDAGAGEQLLDLLTALLDMLTALVDAGVFGAFTDMLISVANALQKIAENPIGGELLAGFAALAAFVAPLGLLAGVVLKVAGGLRALGKIKGLDKVGSALGKLAGATGRLAGRAGGKLVGAVGKGGLIGAAAGLTTGIIGEEVVKDGQGGGRDIAGAALSGAGTGAGIGAIVGSVVPVIGTGIGAAVGGVVGAGAGALNETAKQHGGWSNLRDDINEWDRDTSASITGWVDRQRDNIGRWDEETSGRFTGWVSARKDDIQNWDTETSGKITGWVEGTRQKIQNWDTETSGRFTEWAGGVGDTLSGWASSAGDYLGGVTDSIGSWWDGLELGSKWDGLVEDVEGLPDRIMDGLSGLKDRWSGFWSERRDEASGRIGEAKTWVTDRAGEIKDSVQPKLDEFGSNWTTFWDTRRNDASNKMGEARDWVRDRAGEFKGWAQPKLDEFAANWGPFWQDRANWVDQKAGQARDWLGGKIDEFSRKIDEKFPGFKAKWDGFWTGAGHGAADAVNWVIDNVVNNGVGAAYRKVDGWLGNKLPDWENVNRIAYATGGVYGEGMDSGVLSGYTPGRDVHSFVGRAGRLLLSGGEAIMRPEWTRALGARAVHAMNAVARSGGVQGVRSMLSSGAGALGGAFADGGVLGSGGPVHRFSNAGIIELGKWFQSKGARVTENSAFGGTTPGVHKGRGHREDYAIDVNYGPGGQNATETAFFDQLANLVRSWGYRVFWRDNDPKVHSNHLHAETQSAAGGGRVGGGGLLDGLLGKLGNVPIIGNLAGTVADGVSSITNALSSIGNAPNAGSGVMQMATGAFTQLAEGAKTFLSEKLSGALSVFGIGGSSGDQTEASRMTGNPGVDALKSLARTIAAEMGVGNQFDAIDSIFTRESSWNPNAKNPNSTAAGIPQFLAATRKQYARFGWDPAGQIRAGIQYMIDRYGSPNGAQAFWARNHWYRDGGIADWVGDKAAGAAKVFDRGGWLMPGEQAINLSSSPEPVFNGAQWSKIDTLIDSSQDGDFDRIAAQLTELNLRLNQIAGQFGNVNVYPRAAQSEEEIARIAAARLMHSLRS